MNNLNDLNAVSLFKVVNVTEMAFKQCSAVK